VRGISRFNFHLNEEHDYYLIEFIQSHKNQSRVIRDLLRAGYTILQGKNTTINTSKIKQKETFIKNLVLCNKVFQNLKSPSEIIIKNILKNEEKKHQAIL